MPSCLDPDGHVTSLPAKILYKKNILAFRGSFRPVTKVNIDMYEKSFKMFLNENRGSIKIVQKLFLKLHYRTSVLKVKLMKRILWIAHDYYVP